MARDQRLDEIQAPQFGQTYDRNAYLLQQPGISPVQVGGPLINPRHRVIDDWTIYIGRNVNLQANPTGLYTESHRIQAKLFVGTGQSAFEYEEILSVPNVGCCIHFSTQTIKVELSWPQPIIPGAGSYNRIDQVITWAAPGRPAFTSVRRRAECYGAIPFPYDQFVVANGTRIPSFAQSVRVREADVVSTGPAAVPFNLGFYTPAGQLVGYWRVAAGTIPDVTIPPAAAIVIAFADGLIPAQGVLYDFTVNA